MTFERWSRVRQKHVWRAQFPLDHVLCSRKYDISLHMVALCASFVLMLEPENKENAHVSASVEIAPPRDRSIEARRAARLKKFKRERRILDLLNRGVSVAEIAAREGVRQKSMRAIVRDILARRMPEPPAEFVALQVSRLNEALLVAYGAMSGTNLRAVDRVVKIVRELDRYHGFVAVERRSLPDTPRLKARAQDPALEAPPIDRLKMAPQQPERIEFAPGVAMAPISPRPQDVTRDGALARPLEAPAQGPLALVAQLSDRLEMVPQALEKTVSAPELAMSPAPLDPQDVAPKRDEASRLAAPAESLALEALVGDRPENALPAPENLETPGNGMAEDEPPAPACEALEGPAALDAPLIDRLEMARQALENAESGPGKDPQVSGAQAAADGEAPLAAPAQDSRETPMIISLEKALQALENVAAETRLLAVDAPPSFGPFVGNPGGPRWPNVRATLNGVAAC